MALRVFQQSGSILKSFRNYSTNTKFLNVSLNSNTGVTTIALNRPPVNSLNLEILTELSEVLSSLESSKSRGLILTSTSNKVFSAGLDITEMYKPDLKRAEAFWRALQSTWLKLFGSSYPTVAAINGHAPAGGCLLSLCCEYRVMVKDFTIGLNETQLGIVAPSWFVASMLNTISRRQAELALTTGKLFTTSEALNVNLVDEDAENQEDAIKKAEKFLARFEKISPMARTLTKQQIRQSALQDLIDNREKDVKTFLAMVTQEKVQKGLEFYLALLKSKSKN